MRQAITLLLFSLMASTALAQENATDSTKNKKGKRELYVYTEVKDHITHEPLDSTLTVQLLNAADSTFADSAHIDCGKYEDNGNTVRYCQTYVIIKKPGKYLLKFEAPDYYTRYIELNFPKLYKNEKYHELKTTYMRRLPKKNEYTLDEVVVTATKLKFYMDGDTLVYNADAFSLAEGSMLDALIKKLPGVELNKGGEIKVNGKKVDALLLNGKDFFDSDRELMLENMPAYMVKNIQSYERTPEDVKGTNREKFAEKELVMNIKLKKEYATGWIANAEGGGGLPMHGTDSQFDSNHDAMFLARLFGLRFTDNSRLTLYAKANNLNDDRTPGENGDWSPLTQSQGLTTRYETGVSYRHGSWEKGFYDGSATVTYADANDANHTSSETFLEGGSTFGRSFYQKRSYDFGFNTRHQLYLKTQSPTDWYKQITFSAAPSFNFINWNNHSSSASATFSDDVASLLGKAWMDSIAAPNACELLRDYAINRTTSRTKAKGHYTAASVDGTLNFTPAHNDMLDMSLSYEYRYTDRNEDNYEHYRLDNPKMGTSAQMFQNKYTPLTERTHNFRISPNVHITLDNEYKHQLYATYSYTYNDNYSNTPLYLLNKLDAWGDSTLNPIGTLPSEIEMLSTLDASNSTRSKTTTRDHTPQLQYTRMWRDKDNDVLTHLVFSLPLSMRNEKLDYWRGNQIDTVVNRSTTFLNPFIYFRHSKWKTGLEITAHYQLNTFAPNMTSMLNITDTSNPLIVSHGNPNLKNTTNHSFSASYRNKFGRTLFNIDASGSIQQNSVAYGFIYNKTTGVRTTMPDNVNGNWNFNTSSGVDFPFDKAERWRLKENVAYYFTNSVDLSGVDNDTIATRSVVRTHNITDNLTLTFRPNGKMEFSAVGNIDYQHSTSPRMGFETINAVTFNYGATAQLELPWDIQFASDITMYSRRGYSDESMNTNELVWNARLTKRLMHGNLLIQFDGFDLLGKLSNVRRSINAQGRTETFYNVIPSYGLLHVTWKLNKHPKRKSE